MNALPPKSAPASPLKAVLNSRLAKVALLEPLPTLSVRTSSRRMGLLTGFVYQLLPRVALEGKSASIRVQSCRSLHRAQVPRLVRYS